jgi:16S rRNA processing protein RimM
MSFVRIGLIVKPQGIKGEVKIQPLTDDPGRYDGLENVFVEKAGDYKPCRIMQSASRSGYVFMLLECVNTRDAAETLRGAYIAVSKNDAITLQENTFLIDDLIGCRIYLDSGEYIGKLTEVIRTGANDVYTVVTESGTILIPAIKKVIKKVDIDAKRIEADAMALKEVALLAD